MIAWGIVSMCEYASTRVETDRHLPSVVSMAFVKNFNGLLMFVVSQHQELCFDFP